MGQSAVNSPSGHRLSPAWWRRLWTRPGECGFAERKQRPQTVEGEDTILNGPHIGQRAPSFRLFDLDGNAVESSRIGGRETLLIFWNPNCRFCNDMLADLRAWERDRPMGTPDILVISTGADEPNRALGLQSVVLLDARFSVGTSYGVRGTPTAILVDANGNIASEPKMGRGCARHRGRFRIDVSGSKGRGSMTRPRNALPGRPKLHRLRMPRSALLEVIGLVSCSWALYLSGCPSPSAPGGGGCTQSAPDSVKAGEPAMITIEFSVWGAPGGIQGRCTQDGPAPFIGLWERASTGPLILNSFRKGLIASSIRFSFRPIQKALAARSSTSST